MTISPLQRVLFRLIERAFANVDRQRIWRRLDMEAPRAGEVVVERQIAAAMAPHARALAFATLAFFAAGVLFVYGAGPRIAARLAGAGHGAWGPALALLLPLACGVLVHGLFVLVVHEATHGNLFGGRADGWISNIALGALLLPFTAESYQHLHRIHHKLAVKEGDPNWTPFRQRLFVRSRWLYALYELIPVVNNVDRLRQKCPRDRRKVAVSWAVAVALVVALRPAPSYLLLVVVGLNVTNAVRLWTEHFGRFRGRVSSVYWCPLGFGIGNHALHHESPRIPAVALAIGLALRQKDGSMARAPYHVLFTPDYRPFRTFQSDFDGSNV